MNQRRTGSSASDTSSFYSASTVSSEGADSELSVWSTSESDSFVWRDDPWGFYGIGGAVTRYVDERDDRRKRFASHILSGPFAQFRKKARQSSAGSSGRFAANSRSTSRPGATSPGKGNHHFAPGPAGAGPPFPPPQFQQRQFHQQQNFRQGGPPPPPPPPVRPPANAGFEDGFIQLGGNNGGPPPPPQQHGDPWGNAAG
ncbi:hypothetical protein GGR52DRAFT_503672 [Hypoxylon sp. FL1284]|nr:hypothetical protein GGR52DRAFT_503672 [Hypoxylon sp. FL1284]